MSKKKTVADFPELVSKWHPTKNKNLNPKSFAYSSDKKLFWKCYQGTFPDGTFADDHEWEATAKRVKRRGCPYCVVCKKKAVPSNCLATTHPELANQWHPTKNKNLKSSDVTFKSSQKIWWKCPVADDHEWQTRISNRILGKTNCPFCSLPARKVALSNCLATTHPDLCAELANQWHPTKNGSLTMYDITIGSHKKIWWKCSVADDHEWQTRISNRQQGKGCPCCVGQKIVLSNCLATTHPELANQWHPTKNGSLTPYDIGSGDTKKTWWKCSVAENHEWQTTVDKRTQGRCCPICKESKGEREIRLYLKKYKIYHKPQYSFKKSTIHLNRFDFATNKGLIEYHGEQHYIPVNFGSKKNHADVRGLFSAIQRDLKKEQWCKKHRIPLLVIPYWDFDRIPEILDAFLKDKEPVISKPPKLVFKYKPMRQKIIESITK